ncbi:MAG: UMP kinase [Planctomycetaceae bacterium]|jgi:uridylate kinase|nr:UMP kinase [Planctomycetaceae bacterium]
MIPSAISPLEKQRRVVLKISGECFCLPKERGIAMSSVMLLAEQVAKVAQDGIQIAVVMGGGNILRGGQFKAANVSIQESTAHYMGMLATVINGMALQDAIELVGQQTRLMTAFSMESVAEPYIRRRAVRHLEKGRIILLAGGTGSPFVTTDTAAAQRALELNADVLLKATKVDGVYSDDPETNPHAVLYPELTYEQVQQQRLRIMDQESIAKCGEHRMPVMIFNFRTPGNLERALKGERVGTLISGDKAV